MSIDTNQLKKLQKAEWEAWQNIVVELRVKGIEINDNDNLTRFFKIWADKYHKLHSANKEE